MAGLDLYNNPQDIPMGQPESVPVLPHPSTGELVPAPNAQGLYAVYGQRNPYSQRAENLRGMAFRDRGNKVDLLAPVAAFAAGRAEKKSDEFEAAKQAKIDEFMKRREAYDAIKTNQEQRASNAKYLTDTIFPAAQQAYMQTWSESKDANAASAKGTEIINKMALDAGIPMPEVAGVNFWKGATSFAVRNEKGEITTAVFKDGALAVQNKDGKFEPPNERWMSVKDVSDLMRASRASSGPDPRGMQEFYDDNGNLVAKTKDQAEALRSGATRVGRWVKTVDDTGNEKWTQEMVPLSKAPVRPAGQLDKQGAPASAAPAAAQKAALNYGRPNPVPGSPGSGQQPAPAPATAPAPAPAQGLIRRSSGGRIALFDPNTKAFVRWE